MKIFLQDVRHAVRALAAMLATYIPALRATTVDPVVALRDE